MNDAMNTELNYYIDNLNKLNLNFLRRFDDDFIHDNFQSLAILSKRADTKMQSTKKWCVCTFKFIDHLSLHFSGLTRIGCC